MPGALTKGFRAAACPGAGRGWEGAAPAFPRLAAEGRPGPARPGWRDPQAPRRGPARLGGAGPSSAPAARRGLRAAPSAARRLREPARPGPALPHGFPGGGGARSRAAPGRGAPRLLLAALLHRRRWVLRAGTRCRCPRWNRRWGVPWASGELALPFSPMDRGGGAVHARDSHVCQKQRGAPGSRQWNAPGARALVRVLGEGGLSLSSDGWGCCCEDEGGVNLANTTPH